MKALIIILIIFFFIALFLMSKIKIRIIYSENMTVKVGISPVMVKVYPKKNRKKKIRLSDFSHEKYMNLIRKSHEIQEKEKNDKDRDEKESKSNEISEITDFLKFLFSILSDFASKLETRIKFFRFTVGGEDAADAATKFGLYSQGIAYLLEFLDNKTRLKKPKTCAVSSSVNFLVEKTYFIADFSLSMRIIHALRFLFRFLSHKLEEKSS